MPELTRELWLAGSSLLASCSQSVTGFGFGLTFLPLATIATDVREAIALTILLTTLSLPPLLWEGFRAVEWRLVAVLFATSLVGMPLGALLLFATDATLLTVIVAVAVMGSGLALLLSGPSAGCTRQAELPLAGVVSGMMLTSTSLSGPPVMIHLLRRGLGSASVRATIVGFFLCTNLVALVVLSAGGQLRPSDALPALALLPAIWVGLLLGRRIRGGVSEAHIRVITLVMLILLPAGALGAQLGR